MSTFFSLMLFPHFLAGFACMIAALLLLMAAWSRQARPMRSRVRLALGAGAVLFFLTFFHPYDVVALVGTACAAPLLFALVDRGTLGRDLKLSLLAVAVWIPAVVYNYFLFTQNPAMRAWDLQNIMVTPTPLGLVIGFGLCLPLALLSLVVLPGLGRPLLVMWAWLAVILVCIHLPVRFQRRMIGGVQFPLAGLAAAALFLVLGPLLARARPGMARAGVVLGVLLLPLQAATPYYVAARSGRGCAGSSIRPGSPLPCARRSPTSPPPRVRKPWWWPPTKPATTPTPHGQALRARALRADHRVGRARPGVVRFFAGSPADDAWRWRGCGCWRARYLVLRPLRAQAWCL